MARFAVACGVTLALAAGAAGGGELTAQVPANPFAYIPPQCWTKTRGGAGTVHNPCYACHVAAPEPNFARDEDLQLSYDFADGAAANPWSNLFVDRGPAIAATSDTDILAYVRTDNFHGPDGGLALATQLDRLPAAWDVNGDGIWSGYRPDIWLAFDDNGFDHDPAGRRTGWRAFAYKPLPGAFWPTNGSADDVAIRLPAPFRAREDGTPDDAIYALNLAILESLVARRDVPIPATDETRLGVDLDRDGSLGTAGRIVFAFDPRNGITMSWVGQARAELQAGRLHLAALLFPEGTEFVHSVRYLDLAPEGTVVAAPRLKELRYARKTSWRSYTTLMQQAQQEMKEAVGDPDEPERFFGDLESGVANGKGWRLQGFIEAADGRLRPQTYEESLTCVGCHGAIGRGVDSVIAFPRKLPDDAPGDGWYHWDAARPLGILPDADAEYATYLRTNGAADEFRANDEAWRHFTDVAGVLDPAKLAGLRATIAPLVEPSAARALALDKAYRLLVREQSFARGRLAVLAPLDATVHRAVEPGATTGIPAPMR